MYKIYTIVVKKSMHDTHIRRALHISSCIMKKIQVITPLMTICQLYSMQLQKEVKSNPKTAQL